MVEFGAINLNLNSVKTNMTSFRENRNLLLNLYSENLINDEEFCLLFDTNNPSNRDFEYWNYEPFDLSEMSDDDYIAEF